MVASAVTMCFKLVSDLAAAQALQSSLHKLGEHSSAEAHLSALKQQLLESQP
jgi:hypothetical protein